MATKVNNLVEFMQAGETLLANDAVYVDPANGKLFKLDVTDDAKNKYFGIAKDAGILNDWIRVVQSGKARGFSGLTPGEPVYASVTVPGSFQLAEPSARQQVTLGTAKSATELIINAALSAKTGGGVGASLSELMEDPSFENGVEEFTVTNATVTQVASTRHGDFAAQATFSAANGRACIQKAVPVDRQMQRHEISCDLKTADAGVEIVLRNNNTDRGSYEVVGNDEWTSYSFLADANNNLGFCIEANDTDVVLIDNCSITSDLSKRAAVDCPTDADCENQFSARLVSTAGCVVADQSPSNWLSCVSAGGNQCNCTVSSDIFTVFPNITHCHSDGEARAFCDSRAGFNFRAIVQNTAGTVNENRPMDIAVMKNATDHKTIPERGVINVNMDAQNDSDPAVYTPVTQGFGTISPSINQCEFAKSGAFALIDCRFTAGILNGSEAQVGLPAGLVIASGLNLNLVGVASTAVADARTIEVLATSGDSFLNFGRRDGSVAGLSADAGNNAFPNSSVAISFFARVPIQGWSARQEIVADLSSYPRVTGESGFFAEGWASFGGASDNSICNASPCTRYGAVGNIGNNMSATRSTTGIYVFSSTGWKPNSSIFCSVGASGGSTTNSRMASIASRLVSNSSGEANGYELLTGNSTLGAGDRVDTFFTVHCKGEVNP